MSTLKSPPEPKPEEARDGWNDGLPLPLYDLRPQDFLRRAFARRHAPGLSLPSDPRDWDDDALEFAKFTVARERAHSAGAMALA